VSIMRAPIMSALVASASPADDLALLGAHW
jgi:hypothetical protein